LPFIASFTGVGEELVVGPGREFCAQTVGDGVVFQGKDRMEHAQADPPVAGNARYVDPGMRIKRKQTIASNGQLAVLS
jgi:hypothetical protein